MTSDPLLLIDILDFVGVVAFGFSGGLVAVNRGMDIVGVLILAATTGLGGGMMRDVLIGATPPAALADPALLTAVAFAGLFTFFFHPALAKAESSIAFLDAIGLGLFAVAGSFKAYEYGLGPVASVLMGLLTAIGGGVLRDLLSDRVPEVFRGGLYATPAAAGAAVAIGLLMLDVPEAWAAVIGGSLCVGWRLLALSKDWHAPKPKVAGEPWVTNRVLDPDRGWRRFARGRGDREER